MGCFSVLFFVFIITCYKEQILMNHDIHVHRHIMNHDIHRHIMNYVFHRNLMNPRQNLASKMAI